mgnify:CR=1 FL=1
MKVLHLLAEGKTGGIEVLCKNIILNSKIDNRLCCMFGKGEIYDELRRKHAKIFSTDGLNQNVFKIAKKIENYCLTEAIDVVIVHHGGMKCNIIFLLLMSKLKKVKFVRYLHGSFDSYTFGNDGNFLKRILIKLVMQKALERANLIIYISKEVKKSFEKAFKIKTKSKIIYNGIPDKFFKDTPKRDFNNSITIAYVGRLTKTKGIDLLLDAFYNIYQEHNVKMIITGTGELEKQLKEKVNKLNINKFVKFTGRKENVIPILDEAELFVYPSIWEEGFGISVVEAMARGCIPITFKKGGLPEIINNNVNGFMADNVDYKCLSNKILDAIKLIDTDKKEALLMSNRAIETAKKFKIENTIDNINKELKDIVKEK